MKDYSLRGRYYETLFKAECLKRGLVVLQPECSHLAFDVALFVNDKFLRIQVKGTNHLHHDARRKNGVPKGYRIPLRNDKGLYRDQGIDFIAAYVEPLSAWFILPSALATARNLVIRQTPSSGLAAQCRERWDSFGGVTPIHQSLVVG